MRQEACAAMSGFICRKDIFKSARTKRRLQAVSLLLMAWIMPAHGYDFDLLSNTALISVKERQTLSTYAQQLGAGGYELSGGSPVTLTKWYQRRNPDVHFDFMTQVLPGVGILWGVSTGEYAAKYMIEPALKAGVILQHAFSPTADISFSFTQLFRGRLKEKPCVADYGDIGGVQSVNCRLAASTLEPSATLQYLANVRPPDHSWVGVRFNLRY